MVKLSKLTQILEKITQIKNTKWFLEAKLNFAAKIYYLKKTKPSSFLNLYFRARGF